MTSEARQDVPSIGVAQVTVQQFRTTVTLASAATAIVAVAGLLGYVPGLRILGSVRSDYIPMAPSTAGCFVILALALFFHARKPWQGTSRLVILVLVLLVTVFGLLEVVELFVGRDIGVEDRLVPEIGTLGGIPIGRMSPVTGATFIVAGLGTLLLLLLRPWSPRPAQRLGHWASSLGTLTLLSGATVLLAYLYGTPLMYGSTTVPMAATTAVAFMFLGAALVAAAGPGSLPTRLVVGDSTSARLSRVFLPLTVALVLLPSVLSRFEPASSVRNHPLFLAVLAIVVGMITVLVVTHMAHAIGKSLDEANRMLRESEEWHRNIMEKAMVGFWLVDLQGRVLEVNETYCRMSGYSAQELLAMRIPDLEAVESAERIVARTQEIVAQGQQRFEGRHRRKDGSIFPVEVSAQFHPDRGGIFVVFLQDITERKQAAEARQESENSLREAQKIARVGSYALDIPGDAWRSSEVLDDVFGIGADFPRTTAGWLRIVHPEDRQQMRSYLVEVFATHGQFNRAYRIVRVNDGVERWVLGLGRVEYGAAGVPLRMVGTIQDITERKLATEQLRLSEENLAITLQSIGEAVIATDAAGLITRMNAAAERLTGWPLADATGRPLLDVFCSINAETRVPSINPVQLVFERETRVELANHTSLLTRDGNEFQIAGSTAPIRDSAGQMVGVVLVFNDVSEEFLVRKALADSAALLERTGAIAKIGGWELDVRTNELIWSQETRRIHEVDPSEALTVERAINFYEPETRPIIQAAVQAAIDSGTPFDLELPLVTAKGRSIWVRAQGSAVMENGRAIELHGAFQDVTARKQAEDALHESEERFRTLVEWSPQPLIVHRDGILNYVNLAAVSLFGAASAQALVGRPLFDRIQPDFHDIVRARLKNLTDRGDKLPKIEMKLLKIDGTAIDVESEATSIDYDGAPAVLGAVTDITERKRAAEERTALQAQLAQSQKLESLGLLAGGVAHDFNNMLAAILGYAELTALKLGTEHTVSPYVEAIRSAAQRSADLTRQLLVFAREQVIAPQTLILNDTIGSILTLLRRLLGENVKLVWMPGTALWHIEADQMQVDQVLTNLVLNARDAMTGSDAVLEVSTSNVTLDAVSVASNPVLQVGDFVELRVRDNGCGMDAQTLARIFEPFFTTKAQGKGTGLGLSTAYGIVEKHGGFVDVESAPGAGTTFHLYFPRTSTLEHEIPKPDKPLRHGTETILLAEDEEGVRESAAEMLRILGYTVLPTRDGPEAIALAASHTAPIHLLLTDVIMPGMNGAQLRDALLARSPTLKVLFMSGYAGSVISSQGVLAPGTHFIQKPCTMQALAEAVRQALDD